MPKHRLEDLRNHLFETIERLKDKDNPLEVDRARAVAEVAGVILDSAKVEIGYMRVSGAAMESGFIAEPDTARLPQKTAGRLPQSIPAEPPAPGSKVQCLDCGEKFPDAKAMGIHRSRVHFGTTER